MKRFSNEQDVLYKKIYGAVAWPGKKPGFCVIIGETHELGFLGKSKLVFLDELEETDTRKLVRTCGGFDFFYRPEIWLGDTKNAAADKFIREMNVENRASRNFIKGHRRFRLSRSPILDMKNAFDYVYPVLKELLEPERRRLFLKDSKLQGYMFGPQESDLASIGFGDYPAIEALAFAVLELEKPPRRPRQEKVVSEYKKI